VADQRLRELERRYRESGDPTDAADLIRGSVRGGHLEQRLVDIASELGFWPARLVTGTDPISAGEVEGMGRRLREHWGQWELVRLSLSLSRRLVSPSDHTETATLVRAILDAIEVWLGSVEGEAKSAVWREARTLSLEDLFAWSGESTGRAIQHTMWSVTRLPMKGAPTTRAYEAPRLALEVLGLEAYLEVVAEIMIPRLFGAS
jgi:hypothetical protein